MIRPLFAFYALLLLLFTGPLIGTLVSRTAQAESATGPIEPRLGMDQRQGPATQQEGSVVPEQVLTGAARLGKRVVLNESPSCDWVVEGQVRIPTEAPADTSLAVVALAKPLDSNQQTCGSGFFPSDRNWDLHEVLARAPVSADGTFRLAWNSGSTSDNPIDIQLDLDGRFLFLPGMVRVEAQAHVPATIRLEPELGGAIQVQLGLPKGAKELPGAIHMSAQGNNIGGSRESRRLILADTMEFELRAVRPGLDYSFWIQSENYPSLGLDSVLTVDPGQRVELRAQLPPAARVRGVVVDPSGEPIAGAEVSGNSGSSYSSGPGSGLTITDELGCFELRGLRAQPQTLSARADGYLDGTSAEINLQETPVQEGLSIVMDPGLSLGGSIRLPDGEPASGARLVLIPLDSSNSNWRMMERADSETGSGRAREDGSFFLSGLEPGHYSLFVDLMSTDGVNESQPLTARIDSIEAGDVALVLTLSKSIAYTGQVRDDAGQGVTTFQVSARRASLPAWLDGAAALVEGSFTESDGEFTLGGLDPGEWVVVVQAEGHLRGRETPISLPSAQQGDFTLSRTASVTGIVLDPLGAPVPGAEVRVSSETSSGRGGSAQSDQDGRFSLQDVGPGPVVLTASSPQWAPSPEVLVDLTPGQAEIDKELLLTEGGAISGLVFDGSGLPDPGRVIIAQSEAGDAREALSDSSGQFLITHVAPGSYQVIATPEEEANASDEESASSMAALWGEMSMAMANVVEGETDNVVLGAPPRAPVLVNGHVSNRGQAIAMADVIVMPEEGDYLQGYTVATTEEDGGFELQLNEPGAYVFTVMHPDDRNSQPSFHVLVPEVDRFQVDLRFPTGSLAGRVIGLQGQEPRNVSLWIRRLDQRTDLASMMGRAPVQIESDGSFQVEYLHAGRYALSAKAEGTGLVTLHDVVVRAGQRTSDLELILPQAGKLRGKIVDDAGLPQEGATILLWDGDARPLYQLEGTTDREGQFTIEGVPVGDLYLVAQSASSTSSVSGPLTVNPGGEVEVELRLRPGFSIQVSLKNEEGQALMFAVSVQDETGHELAQHRSNSQIQNILMAGGTAFLRRVGPLPPGRYTIQATTEDGRSASQVVSFGGPEGRTEGGPGREMSVDLGLGE